MLTDTACKKAKPTGKRMRLYDTGGMYLEIAPAGGRWWRLKYRLAGKEKRLSLGTYPEVTLAEAREKRDEARRLLLLRVIWGYQEGTPVVSAALKLAPMLFVRPGELRNAKWADIDLAKAEWRFTTSKTKTPHIVPLAKQAVAILRELRPLTGLCPFVFPGQRSRDRPMSDAAVNAALRRLDIAKATASGHGFRATARTLLDEILGYRVDLIEAQLAHAVRDPNGRAYNRTAFLPERKAMMQRWADYLGTLAAGDSSQPVQQPQPGAGAK
jgi:integrase